jgi:hypothetical protein
MSNAKSIRWTSLDARDAASQERFSAAVARLARSAVSAAVKAHKKAGRAIYYRDARGRLIEELANGRRRVVHANGAAKRLAA